MSDGGMSQEEIDKILNGTSDEDNNGNTGGEMSQEDIDKALQENSNDNEEGTKDENPSGGMSQEEINKLVNSTTDENTKGNNEVSHEDADELLKRESVENKTSSQEPLTQNNQSEINQEEIDRMLQETVSEETDKKEFSQEEIDKLLLAASDAMPQNNNSFINSKKTVMEKSQIDLIDEEKNKRNNLNFSEEEKEVIVEIMNASYSAASATLTALLGQTALIKNPVVELIEENDVEGADIPHVILNVDYTKGLEMENTLIFKKSDAFRISDSMMSITSQIDETREMDEMTLSALKEAVNQIMGKSATAMFKVLQKTVDISPPEIKIDNFSSEISRIKGNNQKVVCISLDLEIGSNEPSKIYQVISVENAKEMAKYLLDLREPKKEVQDLKIEKDDNSGGSKNYVNPLLKDVTVKMELVYGTTRKTLKDFLSMEQNHVIELKEEVHEPLKLFANGVLIAEGNLVNADGYYGVEIRKIY
ncbi:FliM/FliN family flagellar motor switch protein [Bacillus cereus]